MLGQPPPEAAHIIDWFRWARLVADCQISGPELIPVLGPVESFRRPERLVAFDRWKQLPEQSAAMLHFYVADHKLRRVLNNPGRYVAAAAGFAGVISPDFSVYRSMPPHQRVFSVWASRAVGAFFQHHGLAVVPTVRWAEPADYKFCFEGLPSRSVLAVSPHGCSRSGLDRHYFRLGVREMLDRLRPTVVLVHGPMPSDVFGALGGGTQFMRFPPGYRAGPSRGGLRWAGEAAKPSQGRPATLRGTCSTSTDWPARGEPATDGSVNQGAAGTSG